VKEKKSTGLRQPGPDNTDEEHARYGSTCSKDYQHCNPGDKVNNDGTISMPHLYGLQLGYETRPSEHPYICGSRTKFHEGIHWRFRVMAFDLIQTSNQDGNEVLDWARRYAGKDNPSDEWGDILRACYVHGTSLSDPMPGASLINPRTGRLEDSAPLVASSTTIDSFSESLTTKRFAESGLMASRTQETSKVGNDEVMEDFTSASQDSCSSPDPFDSSASQHLSMDVFMSDIEEHSDSAKNVLQLHVTKNDQA
jgi:hypothetical protein